MKSVDRLAYLHERLGEAQLHVLAHQRGTVEYRDAVAAVNHLNRLIQSTDGAAIANPDHGPRDSARRAKPPADN